MSVANAPPHACRPPALVGAAIAALGLAYLAMLVYHAGLTVAFPYDLDYGEGYVLNDAVRLARGEPIYTDIQQFPMVRSPYPPLFPGVWSALVPLAGPVFWPGRLLAALAQLGVIGLAAWHACRVRLGVWPVLSAAAVIAASPFVYQWVAYARVDTLALLWSVAGVLVAQHVAGWRGLVGAALLCLLAVWTKQSAVAAPAAIAIALFARRPWAGAAFSALVGLPSLAAAVWLDATTSGQFARHVIQGNAQNPYYPARLVAMLGTFLALHLPLVGLALAWAWRGLLGRPSPAALYVPLSLLAALSVGNGGSSVNYFLEPVAASALAVPYAWRAWPRLAPLLLALQLALAVHWPNGFGTGYLSFAPHGRTPTAADYAAGAAVDARVRAAPGGVLAEPAGFAVRNSRSVAIQPIDLRAEERLGRWRSEPLVAAMRRGEFGLVVTAYGLLPADADRTLAEAFRLSASAAGENGLTFRLYEYQGQPSVPQGGPTPDQSGAERGAG